MADGYPAEVEADLDFLRRNRAEITRHEEALPRLYAERLAAYQRLRAAGVKQEPIAEAAGVGPSAVGVALHDARRKARLAAMTPEEQAADRARQAKARKRKGRTGGRAA